MTTLTSQGVCTTEKTIWYKHTVPCYNCKLSNDHVTLINWLLTILTGLFREIFVLLGYGWLTTYVSRLRSDVIFKDRMTINAVSKRQVPITQWRGAISKKRTKTSTAQLLTAKISQLFRGFTSHFWLTFENNFKLCHNYFLPHPWQFITRKAFWCCLSCWNCRQTTHKQRYFNCTAIYDH